ncbi:hypothetical protein ASD35_02730 [Pelomonas sp. Root1444]|nr:hypothetical protein ASD35_02730 [Pelomonas sp. Root1444]
MDCTTYPRDSALQRVVTAKATGLHGEEERTPIAKRGVTQWESGIEFLQNLELADVEKVEDCFQCVAAGGDQCAEAWVLKLSCCVLCDMAQHRSGVPLTRFWCA